MPNDPSLAALEPFLVRYSPLAAELYTQANAARWSLPEPEFSEALRRSAEKRFAGIAVAPEAVDAYLRSLQLEDLALARACSRGSESAWEFFMENFRAEMRRAARAILRGSGGGDDARAEELADSLYAELYGVRTDSEGVRKSLFEYFHGRSKLSTWLHAVLAQRQVDRVRADSKTVSLDEESKTDEPRSSAAHIESPPVDPHRDRYLSRVDRALSSALSNLPSRERLLVASYYVDQMTLAAIGRMIHEHESTVSRQLDRIRRSLRERVTEELLRDIPAADGEAADPGLDRAQVAAALDYALEDWAFDLPRALSGGPPAANPPKK
jgi:RNA polymerase sigma-70 factor